jgi:outer membrane lipoprotein SlyB
MTKQIKQKTRRRPAPIAIAKRAKKPQEVTRLGGLLRTLGGLGGSAIGGLIGMPSSGSAVGSGLGASLSRWLGSGDYEVNKNSIVNKLEMSGSVPEMHKSDQTVIVRHREFVTTVNSSAAFAVQASLDINPGNYYLFPWLAGIATRFQEYKLRGMVFHYVPTSGSAVASTNAALGSVMLQTSYRASDTAPASKIEMLNEYNSNESVPCEAFCHPIECDPKENPFNIQYVRSNNTATNEDKLLYDLGTTHLAVSGCQTTGNAIGDLWVTYEVELKKPLVSSNITQTVRSFSAITTSTDATNIFSTITSSLGSLPVTLGSGNVMTFNKGITGTFVAILRYTSVMTSCAWTAPTLTNCVFTFGPPGFSTLRTGATTATGLDGPVSFVYFQILDPSLQASITWTAPTFTGSVSGCALSVSPFNVGL